MTENRQVTVSKTINPDKVYFLIGDNLQHMCLFSEQNSLKIESQAWLLNIVDVHEQARMWKHRPGANETSIWIHWGDATKSLTYQTGRKLKIRVERLLQDQKRKGGQYVLEAEAKHWPTQLGRGVNSEETATVFTCGLKSEWCHEFKVLSEPRTTHVPCICGRKGTKTTNCSDTAMDVYFRFCDFIHCSKDEEATTKEESFPTEQAVRQKEALQKKKAELERQGLTKAEIKATTKKKKQLQEDHHDDCGSDTGPIDDCHERALLARTIGTLDDATAYSFYNDRSFDEFSDHEFEEIGHNNFNLHYLLGAEVDEAGPEFCGHHPDATFVKFECFLSHMQRLPSGVDVMEIFGGEGGVTRVAVRRRLKTGKLVDVITGDNLTNRDTVQKMLELIHTIKPLVIVGGPPCTAFGNWSRMNRITNPDSYANSRSVGLQLAAVMIKVIEAQMRNERFFILENPAGSELFKLPDYVKLYKTGLVCSIRFPQCPLGLKSPEGVPIYKLTELWSNHLVLIENFIGLECKCTVHAELAGQYQGKQRSALAQVWPRQFCERIVQGIDKLMRNKSTTAYPETGGTSRRGRPRKFPEYIEFDCPACIGRLGKKNDKHTRNQEPPRLCRWPDEVPEEACPGCRKGFAPDHPSHDEDKGCKIQVRNSGKRRTAGPVRDPATAPAGDALSRNKLSDMLDLDHDPAARSSRDRTDAVPAQEEN